MGTFCIILVVAVLVVGIYLHYSAGKTPTPAPVTTYPGTVYSLQIDQVDLDQATGNTINNNTIYFTYVDTLGVVSTSLFSNTGTFNRCVKTGEIPSMYYYTNNIQRATVSSYTDSGSTCS